MPLRVFRKMYGDSKDALRKLTPTNTKLTSYSGDVIQCFGTISILCKYKNTRWDSTIFYVVDVPGPAILGLPTSEKFKIVTIHIDSMKVTATSQQITNIQQLKEEYPVQFDTIGNFQGAATLHVTKDAVPFIDPPRKCSIHIKEKLRSELERLVEQKVIRKVQEHTDWCSSMAISAKKDGTLRICLDPQKLNASLKRCPHKIPTVEEMNPKFEGAKYFSKLDAKAGYWAVHLDEKSQKLTTFRTPFGRYCWRRLPFGLRVSQDIFQSRMDDILEGLEGVISIADDVAVVGRTEEEHDTNLHKLMRRATEKGLVFNSQKCLLKTDSIAFFGNIYTRQGVQPDPSKVQDIQQMQAPNSKDELQRFMGMLNYLAPYIPKLAETAQAVRELLKKDAIWIWEDSHEQCFNKLKSMITPDACLKYYDPKSPLTLEVDASQKGLGVALTQEGKPIAFASKTLTECQSRYSNIEREMLAIVHGIERYHTYLYGKPFIVVTDHKPLVTICEKPLHAAPHRLRRMLLRIQGYQYSVTYKPGPQMIMADALSRLPNPSNKSRVTLAENIDCITTESEELQFNLINFTEEKQEVLRIETARDQALAVTKEIIMQGWPENIRDVQKAARPFWPFRDELAIEAGIIVKGRQVIVPETMTDDILKQLHNGHQGIDKTRRLARESVYWSNINRDIEQLCKSCKLCAAHQDANPRDPLTPHKTPERAWQYVASDLFETGGKQFLLIVDRYTKFPILEELPSPATSKTVADKMKTYTAIFGRPEEIMTDNGPHYAGQAFKNFAEEWNIKHITSSPHYPQSNGFIERHVRTIKAAVKKCMEGKQDVQKALLNIRATPIDGMLPSPAELMFGKAISTLLPSRAKPGKPEHRKQLEKRNTAMKQQHDKNAKKSLPPMHPGQQVLVRNTNTKQWKAGTITEALEHNSYLIETENGKVIRRTRAQLKAAPPEPDRSIHFKGRERRQQETILPTEIPQKEITTAAETQKPTADNAENTTTRVGRKIRRPSRYEP